MLTGANSPILFVVAAALIDAEGRILIAKRPAGKSLPGLWEFPGGKIKDGEVPEAALVRELCEELGLTVAPADLTPLTFASHDYADFHLFMPLYLCRRWRGSPEAHEHDAIAWARPEELADYPMPPADEPLIRVLRDLV